MNARHGGHDFPVELGRYTLVDKLTEGGMAEIYLAIEHLAADTTRWVTIKRIHRQHAGDRDFLEFFATEGRIALQCSHPNLPYAFELAELQGLPCLILEYIRGHTLLVLLRRALRRQRLLSLPSVMTIAISIAAALEHVHALRDVYGNSLRVIHRDVTPQNVMIGADGVVKLIDFGIARSTLQTHQTMVGVIKGKYAYMAPEQLLGDGRLDQRADVFSLGVVLHECLCGRPLFAGSSDLDTCERVRHAVIADPRAVRADVPRELAALVLQALERDPAQRLASAAALLEGLEHIAERHNLAPSLTRLRSELTLLCGPARAAPTELPAAPRPRVATSATARDPQLAYYLQRAGATADDNDGRAPAAVITPPET